MASPREENVYMAKLAEQSERYEEMVEFMEKVVAAVDGGDELTVEERNLLSVAYKHVIGARRASWQIISSMEQKEESRGNKDYVASIKTYRSKIETELTSICNGILKLLDSKLIGSAATGDSKVFYLKMKGDYYGYLAEFKTGAERKEAAKNSLSANKFAQLAEQAESDKEMVEFMEKVIADELTVEECDNLSIAYKKVIGARRASWQIISSIEKKEKSLRGNEDYRVAFIKTYRSKIETDVTSICNGILKLLDSKLIGSAATADMKVFYLKMKGDYYRYLAEFKTGAERKEAIENTLSAYKSAQDIANAELAPTHTMRLGLALNFSVFYYDILNSPDRACILAKQAIDEAIVDLDLVEVSKDSISILQLLRDNLTLWIYAG